MIMYDSVYIKLYPNTKLTFLVGKSVAKEFKTQWEK